MFDIATFPSLIGPDLLRAIYAAPINQMKQIVQLVKGFPILQRNLVTALSAKNISPQVQITILEKMLEPQKDKPLEFAAYKYV